MPDASTIRRVTFRIFRARRGEDGRLQTRYATYDVPVGPRTTVLEALHYIRRHHAPDLVYRYSCHHASCGTCGVRVNGRERLACITPVAGLGAVVTVEPLAHLPLLADLAVDMRAFYQRYPSEMPMVRRAPLEEGGRRTTRFTRFENCIECGLCLSACPVVGSDPHYLGPAGLAAAWRLVEEPRGVSLDHVRAWVDHEHGCWRCHAAMECSAVCPSAVFPGEAIMSLRRWVLQQPLPALQEAVSTPPMAGPRLRSGLRAWIPGLSQGLGMWAFALNRLTALGLVLYLFLHLWTLRLLTRGAAAWDAFIQKAKTPPFLVLDGLLLLAVLFHGLNGLRLALVASGRGQRHHWKALWVVVALTLLVWLLGMGDLVRRVMTGG